MAEAMIINQQLDASPDKKKHMQQLCHSQQLLNNSQQLHNNNHLIQPQQMTNVGQSDNNNLDGYHPGYMYSCYPFVMSPAKLSSATGQDPPTRNTALLPASQQQQQVLAEVSSYSQQQVQQPVMLHNGIVPSGYISGFYSLVPMQSVVSNEMVSCQQTTTSNSDQNYHHNLPQHLDGQGMQAILGPIIGYPLPYLAQHFQQQFPQQQQLKQQHHHQSTHLSQQFNNNNNMMTLMMEGHRRVIIMKDASIQTEFNEKISEQTLSECPNSFFMGARDGFKNLFSSNDISESRALSKSTDTYSLHKNCNLSTINATPHLSLGAKNHQYDIQRTSNHHQINHFNNFNPYLSNFHHQNYLTNLCFPAPPLTLQGNGQGFCLSNFKNNNQVVPNVCQFSSNANNFLPGNISMVSNKETARNELDKRHKFYRKTRLDQGQRLTNPTFEVKKEFSDIVHAVGNLVAQSGSLGNSEPSSSRASSKSADLCRNPSVEKVVTPNQGVKGQKSLRRNCFVSRSLNNMENGKFMKRNAFDVFGKVHGYLPLPEYGHVSLNMFNNVNRNQTGGVSLSGWSQNAFQKNHDVRSSKRKQQKRQMLANKAAEEEMEEISKDRDNLLKGIMSSKTISEDLKAIDRDNLQAVETATQEISKMDLAADGDLKQQEVLISKNDNKDDISEKFGDFEEEESSAMLEFIEELPEVCNSDNAKLPNSVQKSFPGNNSLEENPSPLSQMSPLTFSPPLSCPNELVDQDVYASGRVVLKIHSRRFREYCSQVLDKEIDDRCVQLLQDLVRFQDQMYHIDPSKAKLKKRFVLGLREVAKHLKMGKLKCVIISPNLEQTQSKGGLDEALKSIIETCQVQEVPFIFALGRRALGRACAKLVPVSVVGIFSYEGIEENFVALKTLTEKARDAYAEMVNSLKKEAVTHPTPTDKMDSRVELEMTADLKCDSSAKSSIATPILPFSSTITAVPSGPPPGGFEKLFPHLGHSRTPSACSAISFVSSVLSEPISENFPQSEPEIESKITETEKQIVDKDFLSAMESKDGEMEPRHFKMVDCDGDDTRETNESIHGMSLISESSLTNVVGNEPITAREGAGHSNSFGKSNLEERMMLDVLHRGSLLESATKTTLMSIHENCELEIPASKTCHDMDQDPNVDVPDGIGVESEFMSYDPCVVNDDIDNYGKWLKKRKLSDRMRRTPCLGDPNDGNDADTEEDRGCKNVDSIPGISPDLTVLRDGRCHETNLSSGSQLCGIGKSRRRRSKEDKSDDDKTIILSKDDEDALVFAFENYSLERHRCRSGSPVPLPVKQVEVILARFVTFAEPDLPEEIKGHGLIRDSTRSGGSAEDTKDLSVESSLMSSMNSSTTSRIESWVAESQKALSLALLTEELDEDVDDNHDVDDANDDDDDVCDGVVGRESGDDYDHEDDDEDDDDDDKEGCSSADACGN